MRLMWRRPSRSKVVVFDAAGEEPLRRMVLGGIEHAVLPSRREVVNLSPAVLCRWLLALRHCSPTDLFNPSRVFGELYRAHLLACLQVMQPKVVVTFIDNSYPFQWASRRMKGPRFIAVQNGVRFEHDVTDWLPPRPQPGSRISMPLLVSFGEFERDLYKRHGHKVDGMVPAGSLRASYYLAELDDGPAIDFDVCLVSQWDASIMLDGALPAMGEGVRRLDRVLAAAAQGMGLKIVVALRSSLPEEASYYRSLFGAEAQIVESDRETMSTYRTMRRSSLSVSFCSTACVECFGWGGRVLLANFSDDPAFDFPIDGPWKLVAGEQTKLTSRIAELLETSNEEWLSLARDAAGYVMAYDASRPAHETVRAMILDAIDLVSRRTTPGSSTGSGGRAHGEAGLQDEETMSA